MIIITIVVIQSRIKIRENQNHTTFGLLQVTKAYMKDFIEINSSNQKIEIIEEKFNDINNIVRLLEYSLRESSFTNRSIEKEEFYNFILKLSYITSTINDAEKMLENQALRDNLVGLFKLFRQQKNYGIGNDGFFTINKVIVQYERHTWEGILNNFILIEDKVNILKANI